MINVVQSARFCPLRPKRDVPTKLMSGRVDVLPRREARSLPRAQVPPAIVPPEWVPDNNFDKIAASKDSAATRSSKHGAVAAAMRRRLYALLARSSAKCCAVPTRRSQLSWMYSGGPPIWATTWATISVGTISMASQGQTVSS